MLSLKVKETSLNHKVRFLHKVANQAKIVNELLPKVKKMNQNLKQTSDVEL